MTGNRTVAAWTVAAVGVLSGPPWSVPGTFEVAFGWEDTFPCKSPADNAEGLAGHGMILVEEYVETGPVARLPTSGRGLNGSPVGHRRFVSRVLVRRCAPRTEPG
jgi:hypothetical protein